MNNYCVYKHTTPNGKVYIGITKQEPKNRWKHGNGYIGNKRFFNAIKKHGWENMKHEVLKYGLTEEEACEYEKHYIEAYKSTDPKYGYNLKTGGEVGVVFTDELREKLSEATKKSYKENPERRKASVESGKNQLWTPERRKKLSDAKMGKKLQRGNDWKKHIGEGNKRRLLSDKTLYQETCERCRKNGEKVSRVVEQLAKNGELIAVYHSTREAARKTGIRSGNISHVCNGHRHTAGGYKWRYAI